MLVGLLRAAASRTFRHHHHPSQQPQLFVVGAAAAAWRAVFTTVPPATAAAHAYSTTTTAAAAAAAAGAARMAEEEFDLVTIGAGSGGVRASRFAAQYYNAKVAVVELPFGFVSSDDVGGAGGTCVIRGCVPKKLLVYGAAFRDEFADAVGFGWLPAEPAHEWKTLIANKAKEISRLNSVYVRLLEGAGVTYVEGKGSLVDARTVRVALADGSERLLKAKNILIATGGAPSKLDIPGAEHAVTSDEALALDELPKCSGSGGVLIIGSGYIAVEFAGIFRGLGADVALMFRADAPLRGFDAECRAQVAENLGKRGVRLMAGSLPTRIERLDGGGGDGAAAAAADGDASAARPRYRVTFKATGSGAGTAGEEQTMDVGLVMMATGRHPRVDGLNLAAAGVELDAKGAVKVDELSATSAPGVWAIGDVTNRVNLTPVALMEGMALAKTVFGGSPTKPDYRDVPSAVFCQPPLASVGLSEEQAVEQLAGAVDVYVSRFKPMKFTISGRDERTLMKLLVHVESDRVVGCHMVGPDAAEIMQGLAIALKCGATKAQFDATIGIHPSAAEEFVTMRSAARRVQGKGSAKL